MILLRPVAHLLGFVWSLALALLCLGIALFCFDGLVSLGSARPDRLLQLPRVRTKVGHFLAQLEAPGHAAVLAVLCGLAAIALGLVLAWAIVGKSRERLAVLDSDQHHGVLAARRRALRRMFASVAGETRDVLEVKRVRLALRRSGAGGAVRVKTIRAMDSEEEAVKRAVEEALTTIADPFGLRQRVLSERPHERSNAGGARA